ncbi:MAG: YicC family protein [Bacteroidia bacterium]|nr:YicC family protein [Bacteroidia bacterium]
MIKSMTGFGKSQCTINSQTYNVEIRSVNSKQLDVNYRITSAARPYETEIKNTINNALQRGKIDVAIYREGSNNEATALPTINMELAAHYYNQLVALNKYLKTNSTNLLQEVLKMPNIVGKQEVKELSKTDYKKLNKAIQQTIIEFNKFRLQEGASLDKEFKLRLANINKQLQLIDKNDKMRITDIKTRINQRLQEVIDSNKIDKNRLEQEMIFYIEKLDVTEEKVRLKNHLTYFAATMKEDANGRKLGFIAQEIGREINTIGSKANNAAIQQQVVIMKDELEKIKEQINNVL